MSNIENAKEYAEGKVTKALSQVVADAYMAGYNAGYQDGYNKVVKDSVSEGSEFVDLGLPSGTLWSSDYVKDDNGNAIYVSQENSADYEIPTYEQFKELMDECKWDQKTKKNGQNGEITIIMTGQFVLVQMEIKSHLKKLDFMRLPIALQEQVKFSFG
jgi:hypothetical protein